ncbi:lactate utilization protein C [Fibrella sp. WM1]|uniref:LutC/YkgG family protein n=1 Tax=Fibrella musci TaxID=3242485 RepID=UPI0035218D8F
MPTTLSKSAILDRIRQHRFDGPALPNVPTFTDGLPDALTRFQDVLAFVGGRSTVLEPGQTVESVIQAAYADQERVAASVPLTGIDTVPIGEETPVAELDRVDLAVLEGVFGVAENGAVWLPEANMLHRALPFITQHLVLLLDRTALVQTMHEAYARIDRATLSYGVFIAGPSKTADIEQSLVIGAHGARSLTVIFR